MIVIDVADKGGLRLEAQPLVLPLPLPFLVSGAGFVQTNPFSLSRMVIPSAAAFIQKPNS